MADSLECQIAELVEEDPALVAGFPDKLMTNELSI